MNALFTFQTGAMAMQEVFRRSADSPGAVCKGILAILQLAQQTLREVTLSFGKRHRFMQHHRLEAAQGRGLVLEAGLPAKPI